MILAYALVSILICLATFHLANFKNLGAVRASALVSLWGVLLIYGLEQYVEADLKIYEFLIFGASFVGMSSSSVLSRTQLSLAACAYALVFVYITPILVGLGGALGFSAFVSVVIIKLLSSFKSISLPG